ncbi:MAG TPA: DUF192 domain-containing protein [Bacteroidales bacterium]|nr:DUF192 domain-containing protein [Bacteroidales bacterium]HQI70318.1 DUF192 domain-containing protein [Bacteroidales bacterium]
MQKKPKSLIAGGIILLGVLVVIVFIVVSRPSSRRTKKQKPVTQQEMAEPRFRNDGVLKFIKNNSILQTIHIEIADDDQERTQGLMYRKSMPDSCGMLFIFETMQPLSFWMKNTYIPLDIIYLDADYHIVSIAAYTRPLSEEAIPSGSEARYVVEVNAGFCDRNKIVVGDKMEFTLN